MSQSYFQVPKTISLITTHYFIIKMPNKRELHQIALNHSSNVEFKDIINPYKDYTKESFSRLGNDLTLPSDNPYRFIKNLLKKTVSKKIKTISNKIEEIKCQYQTLDRQTAKILALSSRTVGKYEFSIGKDVLPEKGLLKKAATIKRFEYSPLGSELEKKLVLQKNSIKN